ncbi:unnamed protein product [Plutella xylostella]|uniref:(diamondback moth) hypothetical protein n=1 Tax=Plutella xylostella TaxID=51655 RepID=A0A8S4F499_PLUXY|nr:unnamed protein product [Plutella xylostella]
MRKGAQSVSQCPGINEEPTTCVPCDEYCRYRLKKSDIACSSVCNAGCRCVDGFYRLDSGECVPVDQCSPPQCYENEYHDTCGPYCEESCATMNNTCQVCLSGCVEGCFCQPGFIRDRYGLNCVTPDQCPQPECDRFEHFETCPNICPLETCRAKLERAECSSLQCCEPQCRCDEGYLRNDSGECIPEEYCEVDY